MSEHLPSDPRPFHCAKCARLKEHCECGKYDEQPTSNQHLLDELEWAVRRNNYGGDKYTAQEVRDAREAVLARMRPDETSEQREDRIRTADFEPGEFAADEFKCGMPSCPGHEDMTQVCESAYGAASKTPEAPKCDCGASEDGFHLDDCPIYPRNR